MEERAMRLLNFKVVASALGLFGVVTFTLCILWDLVFPAYTMVPIWKVLLPGFQGITWGSYFLGLGGIILYALYTALIFVPGYNYFQRRWVQ
jgi:P-type Cu+ transporter